LGLVDVEVGLEAIEVDAELDLRDEQVVVEVLQQGQLQVVDLQPSNPADLGVVLVFVKEVVGELGSHHHSTDEESAWGERYRWTQ
jgi:hypothetical protein